MLMLQGCGEEGKAKNVAAEVSYKLQNLERNYKEVESIAKSDASKGIYKTTLSVALMKFAAENPEDKAVKDMVEQFKLDSSENGVIFAGYKKEYNDLLAKDILKKVKNNTFTGENLNELRFISNEVDRLTAVIVPKRFDEKFVDYINIIASLSPTIDPVVIAKEDLSSTAAVGSQLVGNPQYGQWEQNSSGDMFWKFYVAYKFLDFLEDRSHGGYNRGYDRYDSYRGSGDYKSSSRKRYDSWNNNRNWSYYNDKYVKDYAKPSEKAKYQKTAQRATGKYKSSFKDNAAINKVNKKLSTDTRSKFRSNFSSNSRESADKTNTKSSSNSSAKSSDRSSKYKSSMRSPNVKSVSTSKSSRSGK